MKVAIIKQVLDVFGPWSTVRWSETDPVSLFDVWPNKATYWEMTCLLQADWYVIEQQIATPYVQEAVLRHPGRERLVRAHMRHVVNPAAIPYQDYDVILTFDPILPNLCLPNVLTAYYAEEHWDPTYRRSLGKPIGHYDLFLAHMLDGPAAVTSLPQALSFPYLRDPDTVRAVFPEQKSEAVWVDWRTLTSLAFADGWAPKAEAAAERLQRRLGLSLRYKGDYGLAYYGVTDPPRWGDAMLYLRQISQCRYYLSLGEHVSGAGQGLCDAASLGCLCIGEAGKSFHRLLCHPSSLCQDLGDLPAVVRRVAGSPQLQAEVLEFQDQALRTHFIDKPLGLLRQALSWKRDQAK